MAMHVELVSPERILYSGDAEMVICRTVDGGDVAFLADHAPFLGALEIWPVTVRTTEGDDVIAAVHGGFVHVRENEVILLSDVAELADDVDTERARRAQEAADKSEAEMDDAEAEAALRRARVRLDVAGSK
jgi:F-type H+-transporting ATPase subunit epsilon